MKALKVDVTEASTHVVAAAHGDFLDMLKEGTLAIEPHPALSAAAQHALSRPLGGAEALERRRPSVDTAPVIAAELSVWAVLHVEPPRVPRIFSSSGGIAVTPRASSEDPEVVGVLVGLPEPGEFNLLGAARVAAAKEMLERSGFDLILLDVGAAAPIVRRSRRHWWRRAEWREER